MKKGNYGDWLLAALAAGAILGTAAVNLAGDQLREQAGDLAGLLAGTGGPFGKGTWELLRAAAFQRAGETAVLWAAGRTASARLLCCLLAAYMGISISVILGVFTWENGLLGLPYYLVTVLPQSLFYIPLWTALAETAGRPFSLRLRGICAGAVLLAAGVFCEGTVGPWLAWKVFGG